MQNPTQNMEKRAPNTAQHCNTLYNLRSVLDGSSVKTRIHTEFTPRVLDSFLPNFLHGVRPPASSVPVWPFHSSFPLHGKLGLAQEDYCPNCGQARGNRSRPTILPIHSTNRNHTRQTLEHLVDVAYY